MPYFLVTDYYYARAITDKSMNASELSNLASLIYENCVSQTAPYQVNLSATLRDECLQRVQNLPRNPELVFVGVRNVVLSLIETNLMVQLSPFEADLAKEINIINIVAGSHC